MSPERISERLKKFDAWYQKRIFEAETRLSKMQQQYVTRRKELIEKLQER